MNAGDEVVRGLRDVLRSVVDGAWRVGSEHDSGCLGDVRYCVLHCPILVQVEVPLTELADILAAHVLGLVAAAKAEALREAAKELPGFDGIRTHGDAARWLRDRADGLAGQTSAKGNPQLSAAFVEWLMGHGVVPQQAEAAIRWLLARVAVAA